MLDTATIRTMSREQAKRAAKAHLEPFPFWEEDRDSMPPFPFPYFGDYRPKGYRLVKTYFVDSSGFGAPDEPALTIDAFIKELKSGRYYAVLDAGEFQVYVGEFVKVHHR